MLLVSNVPQYWSQAYDYHIQPILYMYIYNIRWYIRIFLFSNIDIAIRPKKSHIGWALVLCIHKTMVSDEITFTSFSLSPAFLAVWSWIYNTLYTIHCKYSILYCIVVYILYTVVSNPTDQSDEQERVLWKSKRTTERHYCLYILMSMISQSCLCC